MRPTRFAAAALAVGLLALEPAAAQQRTPGPCPGTAQPGGNWASFSFVALKLSLSIPPDLRPAAGGSLGKVARRAREGSIPLTTSDDVELVAAWHAAAKAPGELRQVLLYSVPRGSVPSGRPCALSVARQPALVFRVSLTAEGSGGNEYWTEAHWPGFVLAAGGRSPDAYDVAFAVLRSIATMP